MEKVKIAWRNTNLGTTEGYVGEIRVFYIARSVMRDDGGRQYQVRTDLPGIQKMANGRQYKTPVDAKMRCEVLFDRFFDHLVNNRFPNMSWES